METRFQVRCFDADVPLEEFARLQRIPVVAVLDNLRSAFNVGSIVRTADCFRVEKVFFCGITPHPPHRKLDRTSMGAVGYVPWETRFSALDAVLELKKKGVSITALELTDQSVPLWKCDFDMPTALVIGNEALGISPEVMEHCDRIVEIPVLGFKNSLNVAVGFGIAVSEIQRRLWPDLTGRFHDEWRLRIRKV